jgi:hypothetical protein
LGARATSEMWLPPDDAAIPHVVSLQSVRDSVCPCGTRMRAGGSSLVVRDLTPDLRGIFYGQEFCSPRCVRAFFLQALIRMDQLDTPIAERFIVDLRVTFARLASALAVVLDPPAGHP